VLTSAPVNSALRYGVAAGVFVVALAVYLVTLTPTVALVDSGALTLAAWSTGNAHPPGFPLYLMVTKLFTLLPFGATVAVRANVASAVFAALACAMVTLAVSETRRESTKADALVAAFAGLLLAFSRTLWGYATVAEVYALNTFLIAAIVWLMLSWRRTGDIKRLHIAALLFGLALGVHHVTVGLTLIGIAVLVFRTAKRDFFTSKHFAIAAALAIAALLAVYAYLPLSARRQPVWNWGDPDTMARVVHHITARQYRAYVSTTSQGDQLGGIVSYVTRDFAPRWMPLALLLAFYGLYAAFKRDRSLFWMLLLMILACSAWLLIYPIVNDQDAYLLPAFVALAIASAFGVGELARGRVAFAAVALALPLFAAIAHWPDRDRSNFLVAKDYVDNTLRGIAPNSVLITDDWQLFAPLVYFREVEKLRQDVIPIEYGMLIRSWYIRQLERRHPELMGLVKPQLDAYKPLLDTSENDAKLWADPAVQADFNQRLDDLVFAIVQKQIDRGGHVYAGIEVGLSTDAVDANLVRRLQASYDMVPRALALQLLPGHQTRDVTLEPLELRGLANATDEVVQKEVLPSYRTALLIRARFMALIQKFDAALAEYQRALALDPGNPMIEREIQSVRMRSGR
jgi:Protein of unknown function (DUF2723)